MGYIDEDFGSHLWFAVKFFVVLIFVRLVAIWLGWTNYWPVLDDIISFLWSLAVEFGRFVSHLFGGYSPRLS